MTSKHTGLKNKRVLVSGADGFIGSHLVDALKKLGAQVKTLQGDILSTGPQKGFDVVFHLAALTDMKAALAAPQETFEVNVLGTLKLLEASADTGKFVYISTLGVYGEPKHVPIDEDHPKHPIEPYAASKLAGEAAVEGFCRSHKVPYVIVRSFNVYGKGQRPDFVVPRLIDEVSNKSEVVVRNPKSTRDFIYIDDLVEGLIAAALNGKDDVYNLGTGKETSIEKLAKTIARFTKRKVSFILQPEHDGRVKRSRASVTKAKRKLGWSAKVSLEKGITKMLI